MTFRIDRRALGAALLGAAALGALSAPALAQDDAKTVAIANFGPHVTLDQAIGGFKKALADKGFVEGENITYEYAHGNFDPSLVPQILRSLEAKDPDLLVTITTPITQAAVDLIEDKSLPIVFTVVTDPVAAGVVPSWESGSDRFVGSSNMQSLEAVLQFAGDLLGEVTSMGMLYNPGDVSDTTQLEAARAVAEAAGITFKAEGVESVNDIQQRTMALRGVDFIYIPSSSLLQPAVPAAASAAERLGVPIINASHPAVREHAALASISISWEQVGYNSGLLAAEVLNGASPASLSNNRPGIEEHVPLISARRLEAAGMTLPEALADCDCVVD
jgi:putative ABC transport system substrate-binding protein